MAETRKESCLAHSSIPGYSGHAPSFARAPVPVKIAGRLGFYAAPEPSAASSQQPQQQQPRSAVSEYRTAFLSPPGGMLTGPRPLPRPASSPLAGGAATTGLRPAELSDAASSSTAAYASARAAACAATRRALSADGGTSVNSSSSSSSRSSGGSISSGSGSNVNSALWYRTTYGSANAPVVAAASARHASQKPASAGAPLVLTQSGSTQPQQQRSMPTLSSASARFDGATTYLRDFAGAAAGATATTAAAAATAALLPRANLTSGSAQRSAAAARYGCNAATTAELGSGTARACTHVPGYTGFVPSSPAAPPAARLHGAGAAPRSDRNAGALLAALGQFSRGRAPGYTGHKPAAATNSRASPPPPTTATMQGFYNEQLVARGGARAALAGAPRYGINSRAGLLSFFTQGVQGGRKGDPATSDNGLANAASFFKHLRPLEGRAKGVAPASKTTHSGARFDSLLARAAAAAAAAARDF